MKNVIQNFEAKQFRKFVEFATIAAEPLSAEKILLLFRIGFCRRRVPSYSVNSVNTYLLKDMRQSQINEKMNSRYNFLSTYRTNNRLC